MFCLTLISLSWQKSRFNVIISTKIDILIVIFSKVEMMVVTFAKVEMITKEELSMGGGGGGGLSGNGRCCNFVVISSAVTNCKAA